MPEPIRIYVVKDAASGRTYAATVALLQGEPFQVNPIDKPEPETLTVEGEVDVATYFQGKGTWHTVTLVDDITGEMDVKIENRQWTKDDEGQPVKSAALYDAAVASVAIKEWDFKDSQGKTIPTSLGGFQSLPMQVRRVLGPSIRSSLYYGVPTHKAFTASSTGS